MTNYPIKVYLSYDYSFLKFQLHVLDGMSKVGLHLSSQKEFGLTFVKSWVTHIIIIIISR